MFNIRLHRVQWLFYKLKGSHTVVHCSSGTCSHWLLQATRHHLQHSKEIAVATSSTTTMPVSFCIWHWKHFSYIHWAASVHYTGINDTITLVLWSPAGAWAIVATGNNLPTHKWLPWKITWRKLLGSNTFGQYSDRMDHDNVHSRFLVLVVILQLLPSTVDQLDLFLHGRTNLKPWTTHLFQPSDSRKCQE